MTGLCLAPVPSRIPLNSQQSNAALRQAGEGRASLLRPGAVLMRILVLNYEYPPAGGGAAVATAALARGLVERGVRVDVVTAGVNAERRFSGSYREEFEHPGLKLYRLESRR